MSDDDANKNRREERSVLFKNHIQHISEQFEHFPEDVKKLTNWFMTNHKNSHHNTPKCRRQWLMDFWEEAIAHPISNVSMSKANSSETMKSHEKEILDKMIVMYKEKISYVRDVVYSWAMDERTYESSKSAEFYIRWARHQLPVLKSN